jgi:hypothetical protein
MVGKDGARADVVRTCGGRLLRRRRAHAYSTWARVPHDPVRQNTQATRPVSTSKSLTDQRLIL